MTFTEAAVEVLRRAGKPLHFKDIAELALKESLLSHVGQDPEVTMGQRLAAMAKREEDRKVVAVLPEGTFALLEWNVPPEAVVDAVAPPLGPEDPPEVLHRPREREPRAIHAQARRRLAELQAEHEEGYEEAEAERRRQDARRKKFPPPAEVMFEALAMRQSGAPVAELAQQLVHKGVLSEGLLRDLPSLVAALQEDNRRRTEAGRKPAFIVDGERVTLVEFPPPPPPSPEIEKGAARAQGVHQLAQDARRASARALRKRLGELDTAAFEQVCSSFLEKIGMRDVRVAKRSKEGPLYLARHRRGVSDLRVAVKLVRGAREIGRADVQELRKDLSHYSAQMGLVLAPGEAAREARSESSAAGQPPVALYSGDALAEEMIGVRVGVTIQVVEVAEVDESWFASLSRGREDRQREDRRERREREEKAPPAEPTSQEIVRSAMDDLHLPHEPPLFTGPGGEEAPAPEPPSRTIEDQRVELSGPLADVASVAAVAGTEAATEQEPREGRRRRKEREERRATTAAEQAWGQPAGVLRFAPPPGPTIAAPPPREPPEDPSEAQAEPAGTAPTPDESSGSGDPG